MDSPNSRILNQPCSLIGDPTSLHDNPNDVVMGVHEGVHDSSQMKSLKCSHICRSDHDHTPGVLHTVLHPLLLLNCLQNPMSSRHLFQVRVGPWPDSDPVPTNHHSTTRNHRLIRRRLSSEGSGENKIGRSRGVGGGGSRRKKQEDHKPRKAETHNKTN
uniref:Uncharacterized protein n=1 Tax=Opuntia streptacantha TaxID=393608 RepID=A0A7C9CR49_OPUST